MSDEPVKIPPHTFGGARYMTDAERAMIKEGREALKRTDYASPSEFWIRTRGLNGDDFRLEPANDGEDGSWYVDIFKEHAAEGSGTDLDCIVAVYEPDTMVPQAGAIRFHEAEPCLRLGKTIIPLYGSYIKSKKRVAVVLYDAQI